MKQKEINNQPLVSVIIPNYNHARYLEQRLDSVFNQTYPNFEVIILDDCSTDNSLEVINRYNDNPHLRQIVVNETNSGSVFKQWDKGINLAKGELIWIAESDDYCELNLLEELVKAYTKQPHCVLAYSTIIFVDDEGNRWGGGHKARNQYLSGTSYLRSYLSMYNYVLNASCAIFSKEAALQISPDYISMKAAGDYLFWVELVSKGNVAIVNKRLSYFRRHASTVTGISAFSGILAVEEKRIYDFIERVLPMSWLRRRLVMAYRAVRLDSSKLPTEVQSEVEELWHFTHFQTPFDKLLVKTYSRSVKYLHYHLRFH